MMRITKQASDKTGQKKKLFTNLVQECQMALPVSRLSEKLRRNLEEFPRDARREIVGEKVEGCAPLFLACKNGSADMVEYLLSACDADIEQRGLYEVLEEGISHHVTPLWCAAVSGRLTVVKVLLRYGADVNAVSDSGSTPIRSACYIVRHGLNTSHFEIIKCLVRAGADLQQPNHFGGTCLINSVQSPELVKFLLESGVHVNAEDVQHKGALHYAVQESRLETAKLLLQHGADPFKKSKYGDDVLQTACLKGSLMIFNYLLESVFYDPARIADAFELMGSTFLLDMHDLGSTLFFWRKAMEIRHEGTYAKYPKEKGSIYVHPVLNAIEINSKDDLEALEGDVDLLKVQALLMTERILGAGHKDTIFRYMYAGAAHADANEYKRCVALWNYALRLKVKKETLLSCDTSFTARAIVQLYVNVMMRNECPLDAVDFKDVSDTTRYVNGGISEAFELLKVLPECKAQLDNFDIVLTTWIHLIVIMLKLAQNEEQKMCEVYSLVKPILKLRPKTQSGESCLHLAVSSSSTLKSNSFLDEDAYPLFPSVELADFFLRCGHDVHDRNGLDETPLHCASKAENFSHDVASLLLYRGAHLDTRDTRDISPLDILHSTSQKIHVMPFISLKCLAVKCLLRSDDERPPLDVGALPLPPNMSEFIRLHKSTKETATN